MLAGGQPRREERPVGDESGKGAAVQQEMPTLVLVDAGGEEPVLGQQRPGGEAGRAQGEDLQPRPRRPRRAPGPGPAGGRQHERPGGEVGVRRDPVRPGHGARALGGRGEEQERQDPRPLEDLRRRVPKRQPLARGDAPHPRRREDPPHPEELIERVLPRHDDVLRRVRPGGAHRPHRLDVELGLQRAGDADVRQPIDRGRVGQQRLHQPHHPGPRRVPLEERDRWTGGVVGAAREGGIGGSVHEEKLEGEDDEEEAEA